ncbi:elongation factor P 5-aminopentanone reductase [Bacillus chungangensis]|uniref:3-oxoacyl-[acyl-carrier protein] reductase n=1 Tax=Bacillus chungangensis TaxID=587633 RepID=A0ABT9WRA5_9BACI|nr:SDR family oxidoreductase [Bacillus chungangensis]MDQ0175737.1 3-oxoacyl-[acyl-carrier protein] reductase [Bacillus chungangensis]
MQKYALLTGASGGIGRATALELAKEGWNLYVHYFQNVQEIERLQSDLKQYHIEVIPIQADLATAGGVNDLAKQIFQLDAIVYMSGIAPYGLFIDTNDDTIEMMLQLHVKSPLQLVRNLTPKLLRNQTSSIVLMSSIWGQTGAACEVIYSTVKGAQIAFVKSFSKEVAQNNLLVNAIAPGAVDTQMLQGFSESEISEIESSIPMGRLAKPEEIAAAVSFLLSPKASYITGQVLAVNGGWYN